MQSDATLSLLLQINYKLFVGTEELYTGIATGRSHMNGCFYGSMCSSTVNISCSESPRARFAAAIVFPSH